MKKILLISFFKSSNLGDTLLSQSIAEYFKPNVCFDISGSEHTKEKNIIKPGLNTLKKQLRIVCNIKRILSLLNPDKYKDIDKNIDKNDIVMLAGGNMLMDLDKIPCYSYWCYRYVKCAKKKGKKVVILFVGAGPTQTSLQKFFIKKTVKLADYVSVRDSKSVKFLEQLKCKNKINLWGDSVFLNPQQQFKTLVKQISLNVYFGLNNDIATKNKLIKRYIELINRLLDLGFNVKLYSSEINDYQNVYDVYKYFTDNKNVAVDEVYSYNDLMKLYKNTRIAVTVRMHSFIIASMCTIPAISLSWQKKVEGVVGDLKLKDYMFDYNNFSEIIDDLVDKIQIIDKNYDDIAENLYKTIKTKRDELILEVEKFKKEYL